jgi:hypothetical protein
MPKVKCRYYDCVYLEDNICGAAGVELDPEEGCLTYKRLDEMSDEDWDEEEELDELWEEEDEDDFFVEEDDWLEADLE